MWPFAVGKCKGQKDPFCPTYISSDARVIIECNPNLHSLRFCWREGMTVDFTVSAAAECCEIQAGSIRRNLFETLFPVGDKQWH
jgi:hypothetical protein